MLGFFKIFGQGILYVILLPLIVAFFALYAVYCILAFLFMFLKATVLFFMGKNINDDFPEDKEAKKRLQTLAYNPSTNSYQNINNNQQPQQSNQNDNIFVDQEAEINNSTIDHQNVTENNQTNNVQNDEITNTQVDDNNFDNGENK